MRRLLPAATCVLAACAPLAGGPLPAPLPADATSTVELAIASPWAPNLREDPPTEDGEPPLPHGQVVASSAFRLHDRVDAGPSFLLDLGPRIAPGPVTGGIFVRVWVTDEASEVDAGIRFEAGWAWAGFGTDVAVPVTDDVTLTFAPGLLATPDLVSARLPLGASVRVDPLEFGVEGGLSAGFGLKGGYGFAPWMGIRVRLSL